MSDEQTCHIIRPHLAGGPGCRPSGPGFSGKAEQVMVSPISRGPSETEHSKAKLPVEGLGGGNQANLLRSLGPVLYPVFGVIA